MKAKKQLFCTKKNLVFLTIMKTKINIPKSTLAVKISSLDANINDDINKNENVKYIAKFVFNNILGIDADVMCLQNINNNNVLNELMTELYLLSEQFICPIQIVPIKNDYTKSINTSVQMVWKDDKLENFNDHPNLIISKYPIISIVTSPISDDKKKHVIVANVNVYGYVLSVYNVVLQRDNLGVSNQNIRNDEISKLYQVVKKNSEKLRTMNDSLKIKYVINDVHIIAGNFNVSDIKNSKLNNDYLNVMKNLKSIDTYKYCNPDKNGFTNVNGDRNCYILILYFDNSNDNVSMMEINNKLYSRHGMSIIKSYVVSNVVSNDYHPIETIFLLNLEKKSIVSKN